MSRESDIETLMRPGGMVPVDLETTAGLVRRIDQLRAENEKLLTQALGVEAERDLARDEIGRLLAALEHVVSVCDDNRNATHPALALKFVRDVASTAGDRQSAVNT